MSIISDYCESDLEAALEKINSQRPLVHVISNYVTLNDVVNVILAAGGAAIAADDPNETAQISTIARALYLNTGMPSDRKLEAMLEAGRAANARGIPIVLDPVGAGSSDYRSKILQTILTEVRISCIRGNVSEIAALSGIGFSSHGVESTEVSESDAARQKLADHLHCILAVSGKEDFVVVPGASEESGILRSSTGSKYAGNVTGCGCMLSGLIACFLAVYPKAPVREQAHLVHRVMIQYGLAQETAERKMLDSDGGTMTFRNELINAVSKWKG